MKIIYSIDLKAAICDYISHEFNGRFYNFIGTDIRLDCLKNRSIAVRLDTAGINIDDNVLVEKCCAGESKAMETLILKYQNRIHNVIIKICGNSEDAAELTQDTFVKVIESIDRFRGTSSFYTWVFRIAVNLTLNHCKRNNKFGPKSLEAEDYDSSGNTKRLLKDLLSDENAPDPAIMAQNRELCDLVLDSIVQLDEAQKAVIVLRDIEGMSYSRIAEVLDIELGTVRSRLSRARSNLRQILEKMTE